MSVPDSLSVVIAAWGGAQSLQATLRSLTGQPEVSEVVVATNKPLCGLAEAYPTVRFLEHPTGTTVPALRAAGIRAASGAIVALSEDNVAFDPGWSSAILASHTAGHEVVGGPVEQSQTASARDWAIYFYEYGRFMPPVLAGATGRLAGNNVSYARRILTNTSVVWADGFYEAFLHEHLLDEGAELVMAPGAIVYHHGTSTVGQTVRQCFHHGRGYAGMRVAGVAAWRRAAWGAASVVLPGLLPGRIVFQTFRKGRRLGRLAFALPYIVLFMTAWAAGEMTGYLTGPGASTRAWA